MGAALLGSQRGPPPESARVPESIALPESASGPVSFVVAASFGPVPVGNPESAAALASVGCVPFGLELPSAYPGPVPSPPLASTPEFGLPELSAPQPTLVPNAGTVMTRLACRSG